MKEFTKENPGTVFVIMLFSFLLASDIVVGAFSHGRPDCDACEAVCGHGNVRTVSVSSCACK